MVKQIRIPIWVACVLLQATRAIAGAPAVWTEHNDNFRSGDNLNETILTPANVNAATFGRLWTVNLDDQAYTQPLYVPSLTINQVVHNVVYVATVNDTVYAFDADTGSQLWCDDLLIRGDSVPSNAQVDSWGACGGAYTDFTGKFGIVGTPVIDTSTNTMYVVARSYSGSAYVQQLHALNILTGSEVDGGPVTIAGSYNGSTFSPQFNNQRPALTLVNGTVYIAWSSHCDFGHYNGFVMGYDASSLQQLSVWADTSDGGSKAGIWQAGQGLTTDRFNNLYVMTGNGSWDGTANFGESFVKLSPALDVLDYFTPSNWDSLNGDDFDLGSAGAIVLPGTGYVFGGGKQGLVYLLNTHDMGHESSTDQVVQEFQVTFPSNGNAGYIHSSPVYFNNGISQYVYIWGENDYLRCFQWLGDEFNSTVTATSTMTAPVINSGEPGGFMSISANGTNDGILWAATPYNGDANHSSVAGILHAFMAIPDGSTLTELWNSKQNEARDDLGNYSKDTCPTISNGKVYVSTFGSANSSSGSLVCYGLLASTPPLPPSGITATAGDGSVYLSWQLSTQATSYKVCRGTSSGAESPVPIATGISTTHYVDAGLTYGTTYYYTVAAVNQAGSSAPSNEANAEPTPTSPLQVDLSPDYNVNAIYIDGSTFPASGGADGNGTAYSANLLGPALVWNQTLFTYGQANAPDAVAAASIVPPPGHYSTLYILATSVNGPHVSQPFTITYSDGSTSTFDQSISDWLYPKNYSGESIVVSCPYRDVYDGTQSNGPFNVYGYSFDLDGTRAVRNITLPNSRNVIELAMDLIPTVPTTPPSNLTAAAGDQCVGLTWVAGANATAYEVFRGRGNWEESLEPIATDVGSTLYTDTDLNNGLTYYYVVKSVDAYGTSRVSNQVSATPEAAAPQPPTNLVASASSQQVTLTWTASLGATGYNIYRGDEPDDESVKPVGETSSTQFTNVGLTDAATYYFVVKALSAAGMSKNSNEASATPR